MIQWLFINALFDVLNIELAALLEWLNANKLTLNVDQNILHAIS